MAIDQSKIDQWFGPTSRVRPDQEERLEKIRVAAKLLAETIVENTPPCADQSDAIRKVREANMTAAQSLVLQSN